MTGRETCDLEPVEAQLWAFGFTRTDCDIAADLGSEHGTDSFECYVDGDRATTPVHVARYRDEAARQQRLGDYRVCTLGPIEGAIECGPTRRGRWLRSFARNTGVLFYASAMDRTTLEGIAQRSVTEVLRGAHP